MHAKRKSLLSKHGSPRIGGRRKNRKQRIVKRVKGLQPIKLKCKISINKLILNKMTNKGTALAWAQGQEKGTNTNKTLFFEKGIIYSYGYHFAIAKRVQTEKAEIILLTKRGYSNTTAKHISQTVSAIVKTNKWFDTIMVHDPASSLLDNLGKANEEIIELTAQLGAKKRTDTKIYSLLTDSLTRAQEHRDRLKWLIEEKKKEGSL